jgi:hypothetical protein
MKRMILVLALHGMSRLVHSTNRNCCIQGRVRMRTEVLGANQFGASARPARHPFNKRILYPRFDAAHIPSPYFQPFTELVKKCCFTARVG